MNKMPQIRCFQAKRLIADPNGSTKHMSKCWEDQVLSSAPIKDCPLPWSWMLGSGVSTFANTRPAKWNFNWVPEDSLSTRRK